MRIFYLATLKRDRGRAADEPDEALKRSLRELIVGDRGLLSEVDEVNVTTSRPETHKYRACAVFEIT